MEVGPRGAWEDTVRTPDTTVSALEDFMERRVIGFPWIEITLSENTGHGLERGKYKSGISY